jgi:serine/threonine protein kinase
LKKVRSLPSHLIEDGNFLEIFHLALRHEVIAMSSRGQTDTSNEYVKTAVFTKGQRLTQNREHDAKESWEEDIDTPSSDSDLEEGEDLKTRLLASMQRSHFDKTPHEFLPRNKFEEIFPTQSEQERYQILPIFKPMEINLAAPTDDDLSLANYILEHCRTLYLVAVFIELKPKFLRTFMSMLRKDGLTDERLPIDMWSMEELKIETKKHPFVLMEMKHSARKPRIWNLKSISKFQNEQWKFLIPTISTTEIFVDFRQKTIPFIAKIDIVGKGGNAIVYIYEIDPAHFEDPPPLTKAGEASQASAEQGVRKNIVAVKEIRKEGNVAHRWEKEVRALAKMNEFKHKHIVRFITSFRRQGTSDDIEHYVMLEWADGGNLSSFRAAYPNPELTAVLIKWVIQQLCGLAEALSKAHYLEDDGSYRHGDLKPENILWFKQGDTKFGTLKIGDWGEAKEHYNGTALRHGTTTQHGTRRYEPPEVSTGLELNLSRDSKFARSRLYDIWAIGCITLEFLIWLMYGLDGLKEFNRLNVGDYGKSDMFYEVSLGKPAKVHPVAVHWMKHMANDPRCSRNKTALGDLLEIVRTGLLIVKLPREGGVKRPPHSVIPETLNSHSDTSRPSTSTADTFEIGRSNEISIQLTQELEDPYLANPGDPRRCLATDFEREMLRISKKIDESYWYQEYTSKPTPVGVRSSDLLSVETIPMVLTRDASGLRYNESELRDYGTKNRADLENWNFECDNKFAKGIFSRWEKLGLSPPRAVPEPNTLCDQCTAVRGKLWSPFFEKTYELEELERNASKGECDLCGMLWTTHRKFPRTASAKVKFWLQDSMIMMDGLESPVLALFRNGRNQVIVSISMLQD